MTEEGSGPSQLQQLTEQFLVELRQGESPSVEDYVARYPEVGDELRDVLLTLQFLEAFKPRENTSEPVAESEVAPEPLERVGEFRILREIGRGGMGVVYEAEQLSLGRHVALKVLPKQAVHDAVAIERFHREARAAAQLNHANIVPIIDVGCDGDLNYYTMQFVRGSSLNELLDEVLRLRRGARSSAPPCSIDQRATHIGSTTLYGREYWHSIARIGLQVCEALAYAHERDVIHRDIKPSNLLLDEKGTVWVTDFGLAKTAGEDLTRSGDVVGTLRFMSPERFKGQCDERADLFSLGATLYELLVLEPAFHSPDRLHLIARISAEDPRNPRAIDPNVPVDLETMVLKALEKDPRRRYQTASEFGSDLARFLAHQPILARRTSLFGRALRWVARNRAFATALGLLVAVLVAVAASAVAVAIRMRGLADAEAAARATVERQFYRSQVQSSVDAIEGGRLNLASRLLDEAPLALRGWEWHHLRSRLDRSVETRVPLGLRLTDLEFSADGELALLRAVKDGLPELRVVRTSDWSEVLKLPDGAGSRGAVLLRGDKLVAAVGDELQVWEIRTKRLLHRESPAPKWVADLSENDYVRAFPSALVRYDWATHTAAATIDGAPWWVAPTPDGRSLVVAFSQSVGLFHADTLEARQPRIELPGCGQLVHGAIAPDGSLVALSSESGSVYVFARDGDQLTRVRDLSGYAGVPGVLAFSSDGQELAVGTSLGRIYLWSMATGSLLQRFDGQTFPVMSLAVDPVSGVLISCDSVGQVRGWPVSAESFDELSGHRSYVYPVTFDSSGEQLVSGGWDGFQNEPGSLRWWDVESGAPIVARLDPGQFVTGLASIDQSQVVAAVQTRTDTLGAVVFDVLSGAEVRRFDGHGRDQVVQVVAHPDEGRVLTVGRYEYAILWDVATGRIEHRWPLGASGVDGWGAAFDPRGDRLALSESRTWLRLIDVESGTVLRRWQAHADGINDLAFTPDGAALVSCSNDDSVGVWDLEGNLLRRLGGHGVDVLCVAIHPDGSRIATGGRDGELLLWDAQNLDLMARLRGHRDYIFDAAWSPDGARLVTSSGDGTLRLWTQQRCAEQVREVARRQSVLTSLEPWLRRRLLEGASAAEILTDLDGDVQRTDRERTLARQWLMAWSGR